MKGKRAVNKLFGVHFALFIVNCSLSSNLVSPGIFCTFALVFSVSGLVYF
jgi:hypothetical protein